MEIDAKVNLVAKDSVVAQTEKTQRPQPWLTIVYTIIIATLLPSSTKFFFIPPTTCN